MPSKETPLASTSAESSHGNGGKKCTNPKFSVEENNSESNVESVHAVSTEEYEHFVHVFNNDFALSVMECEEGYNYGADCYQGKMSDVDSSDDDQDNKSNIAGSDNERTEEDD